MLLLLLLPHPLIKKCRKSWEICLLCFCCTQGTDTLRKHQNDLNVHYFMCGPLLYYKRVDPYLCSELAPVLEGSGSHGRYPQKGTSVDRVSVVFVPRVGSSDFFAIRQKRIRGGGAFPEGNSAPLKQRWLLL